jgi:hypothetical protein
LGEYLASVAAGWSSGLTMQLKQLLTSETLMFAEHFELLLRQKFLRRKPAYREI